MTDTDHFLTLQNQFYNQLSATLGLKNAPFQLLQPSPPLLTAANTADSNNAMMWEYFNAVPSYSLTGQYVQSGGAQFFSNYAYGLLTDLSPAPTTLDKDVPASVRAAFQKYVRGLKPPPSAAHMGQTFMTWADLNHPEYANIGMADYEKLVLNTVGAAMLDVMPYTDPDRPTWSATYADLTTQLAGATGLTFDLSSQTEDSDVSSTWTQGSNEGFLGLWGGSTASSSISQQFAESSVEVSGTFEHATTFQAEPGPWYSSACMGKAWYAQTGAPWATDGTWAQYFDPQKGELARFATALVVVSGINMTVTSDVHLSTSDQSTLREHSDEGMWPFYTQNADLGADTKITHLDDTGLSISITSASGVPIVIGALVQTAEKFTGHATPVVAP